MLRVKWCDTCYEQGWNRGYITTKTGGRVRYELLGIIRSEQRTAVIYTCMHGVESLTKKQREGFKQVVMTAKVEAKNAAGSDDDTRAHWTCITQKKSVLDSTRR